MIFKVTAKVQNYFAVCKGLGKKNAGRLHFFFEKTNTIDTNK